MLLLVTAIPSCVSAIGQSTVQTQNTFATCLEEFAVSISDSRDELGLFEGTIKGNATLVIAPHP